MSNHPELDPWEIQTLEPLHRLLAWMLQEESRDQSCQSTSSRWLGCPREELVTTTLRLGHLAYAAACHRIGDALPRPIERQTGRDGRMETTWSVSPVFGDRPMPTDGIFHVPAGGLCDGSLVAELRSPSHRDGEITLIGHADHASHLVAAADLLGAAFSGQGGPLHGQVIRLRGSLTDPMGVEVIDRPVRSRSSVTVPAATWHRFDANVTGVFDAAERLRDARLPTTRGLLLAGPPGVGKTAMIEVAIAEAAGTATVLLTDQDAVRHNLDDVYDYARALARALVVMEDIDLIAAGSGGHYLHGLLNQLDGAIRLDESIVTLATTNAPLDLDPALRRARRFDEIIEVGLPDAQARTAILRRLTEQSGCELDDGQLHELQRQLQEATGADIEQAVRDAMVLASSHPLTMRHLQDAIALAVPRQRVDSTYL